MRPLEVIHSVERIATAKEIQEQTLTDPYRTGGELNVKQTEEKIQLEQTSVIESNKKESVSPDEKKRNLHDKKRSKKNNKNEEKESDKVIKEPDKGNFLDINA